MSSTPSKTHLSHVVGLRALAIILVVLFHMKASWCPQGFFGVDMFLVISGYFLLAKPLRQAAAFQFLPFVKGKLLRLMPPLCVAIAAALVLVACLQPFGDLCTAAQAALGGLCGVSNILADSRAHDYFAVDTRTDPFMHLWYMGVMFQSLLLFGILFFCWEKAHCSRRCRILSLLFLGGASLALYLRFLPAAWGGAGGGWARGEPWPRPRGPPPAGGPGPW
ncbi:MAG: acyltransferase, partial [Akkermansia sp.]|nr:acyltransferase [Akkermansia sp.]